MYISDHSLHTTYLNQDGSTIKLTVKEYGYSRYGSRTRDKIVRYNSQILRTYCVRGPDADRDSFIHYYYSYYLSFVQRHVLPPQAEPWQQVLQPSRAKTNHQLFLFLRRAIILRQVAQHPQPKKRDVNNNNNNNGISGNLALFLSFLKSNAVQGILGNQVLQQHYQAKLAGNNQSFSHLRFAFSARNGITHSPLFFFFLFLGLGQS